MLLTWASFCDSRLTNVLSAKKHETWQHTPQGKCWGIREGLAWDLSVTWRSWESATTLPRAGDQCSCRAPWVAHAIPWGNAQSTADKWTELCSCCYLLPLASIYAPLQRRCRTLRQLLPQLNTRDWSAAKHNTLKQLTQGQASPLNRPLSQQGSWEVLTNHVVHRCHSPHWMSGGHFPTDYQFL